MKRNYLMIGAHWNNVISGCSLSDFGLEMELLTIKQIITNG